MVAITVVLAAVLYVMVTGLIGGGGGTAPPAVTFSAESGAAGVWTAQVQVSRAVGFGSYQVSFVNETSGAICGAQADLTATLSMQCGSGGTAVTMVFQDLASPSAQQLNSGDKFRISGVYGSNHYTVNLVWKPTGAIIKSVTVPTA